MKVNVPIFKVKEQQTADDSAPAHGFSRRRIRFRFGVLRLIGKSSPSFGTSEFRSSLNFLKSWPSHV